MLICILFDLIITDQQTNRQTDGPTYSLIVSLLLKKKTKPFITAALHLRFGRDCDGSKVDSHRGDSVDSLVGVLGDFRAFTLPFSRRKQILRRGFPTARRHLGFGPLLLSIRQHWRLFLLELRRSRSPRQSSEATACFIFQPFRFDFQFRDQSFHLHRRLQVF